MFTLIVVSEHDPNLENFCFMKMFWHVLAMLNDKLVTQIGGGILVEV